MQLNLKREHLFKEVEYPSRYLTQNLVKNAGILFGILFTFLMLYKPFGVYEPELKFNYFLICILHALSPSLIIYTYFSLLNYCRSLRTHPKKWTLFQEYFQLSVVVMLIGVASFLMRDSIYNNPLNWSLQYFWEEVRNCYLVGILFYFYALLASFYFRSNTIPEHPRKIKPAIPEDTTKEIKATGLFIQTLVKQDDFSFNPNELLFVKADGNYVELTINKNGQLFTELKRISLRQLESQLAGHPFLFRCHRAYLVNIMQIGKVLGNSQGYFLSFRLPADQIPVSRMQIDSFNSLYKQAKLASRHKL